MRCKAEGCEKEAARYLQVCWKHDYLRRYWTNPEFREKRKATKRIYGRRRLQEVRDCIAEALGGWECAICGTTDRDVLSFDHKDGGGETERNEMGGQFPTIRYYYMRLDEARKTLRVLCANCNWKGNAARGYGAGMSWGAVHQRKVRRKLIDLLGGQMCVKCGESDEVVLTIDHVNGGGTADRKKHGGYWYMLHYYLTHSEEAKGQLQVLCRNCNWKMHRARAGRKGP